MMADRPHILIVEDEPAIADTLRQRMGQCAVDLALAAGVPLETEAR